MNELRRDYFTNSHVIIATDRAKRPSDFIHRPATCKDTGNSCSFCPGFEHMTPPGRAVYLQSEDKILAEPDVEGEPPKKGWKVRVIPNLYPAVKPVNDFIEKEGTIAAKGFHEVIIESTGHDRHPQSMSEDEIMLLFSVYRDRFIAASKNDFVKYVSLFRNYGKEAGASLAHPHSQLITLPVVPDMASRRFGKDYTGMIKKEISSPRLILKTEKTVAIAPYASEFPYEVWILPLKPCKNIGSMQDEDRDNMAICARKILSKISRLLSDPAYNYCFVQSVNEDMHMYMRICPKLGTMAGFELNTGLTINSVPPEDAAKYLREI